MLGPKTENAISDGDNNTQIGHNSGTIHVGLTFEQHEANLRERVAELRGDLERAHGAERELLLKQIDEEQAKQRNLQSDYDKTLAELADLKQTLARYDNQIDRTRLQMADAALDRGDRTLARALLTELSAIARARREDVSREEAALEFKLGEIAEAEVRWADAYAHYKRAADLDPRFDTLKKASEFAERAGNSAAALRHSDDLVRLCRATGTQEQLSTALNEHAINLWAEGRFAEAEPLYRQALEIASATIGEAHRDYASGLSNLAGAVRAQGRFAEAEALYRQALEIDRATIGEAHPAYATRLNNLAGAVRAQGRLAEAEALYRQALDIDRATIGAAHPDYAKHLSNLAGAVQAQGRLAEAEALYRQALEIDSATIGEAHPDYATRLNNLALVLVKLDRAAEARPLLEQAFRIFRQTLPPEHPHIASTERGLASLPPA